MVVLGISFFVASVTFLCYRSRWWPFSLLATPPTSPSTSATWRRLKDRQHATEQSPADVSDTSTTSKETIESSHTTTKDTQQFRSNDIGLNALQPPAVVTSGTDSTGFMHAPNLGTPQPTASQLMPPPPLPNRSPNRTVASGNSSLHPPSNGPLPNRNPNRLSAPTSSSLAPPVNRTASLLPPPTASRAPSTAPRTAAAGTVATSGPNPRRKVILSPGHSPLDWAALQKSSANLSGVPYPQRVTPSLLASMNGRKGKPAWSTFQGKVYNIGPYLPFHPGGEGELKRAAGKVGDKLFMEVHPWVNWEGMMGSCLVGFLVDEEEGVKGGLDDMD